MLVFQSRSCTAERRSRCASVEIVWLGATSWEHGIYNIGEIFSTGYWMVRRSQRGECRCLRPRTPWCGVISQLAGSTAPDSGGGVTSSAAASTPPNLPHACYMPAPASLPLPPPHRRLPSLWLPCRRWQSMRTLTRHCATIGRLAAPRRPEGAGCKNDDGYSVRAVKMQTC